jgi:hypothetical protein
MVTTTTATTAPAMSRTRSEADRWKLVREFETSFKVSSTAHVTGANQQTVLSSTSSWFQLRGSNNAQVDDNDKSTGTYNLNSTKPKPVTRVASKHNNNKEAYKIHDTHSEAKQSAASIARPLPRSRSPHQSVVGPKKGGSSKGVIQVSKRRPVEYDLSEFAQKQSHVDIMRSPSPSALMERKTSFFGRTWFDSTTVDATPATEIQPFQSKQQGPKQQQYPAAAI